MKTLVVGATGLVGLEVCRRLKESSYQVRALIRTTADAQKRAELERIGVELAEGDLKEFRIARAGLCGRAIGHFDGVVHPYAPGRRLD